MHHLKPLLIHRERAGCNTHCRVALHFHMKRRGVVFKDVLFVLTLYLCFLVLFIIQNKCVNKKQVQNRIEKIIRWIR